MTTTRVASSIGVLSALLWLGLGCGSDPQDSDTTPLAGGQSSAPVNAGGAGATAGAAGLPGTMTSAGTTAPSTQAGTGAGASTGGGGSGGDAGGSVAAGGAGSVAGSGGGGPAPGGTGGTTAPAPDGVPTLYWLDINSNRVMRSQNLGMATAIVARTGTAPDGVAVDVPGGKIYWTNMGSLLGTGGGSLQRANLDGTMVETIIPAGTAQTPKQMQLDLTNRHVYFCDREGAKLWRAGMDGAGPEAIVSGHGFREMVGVALDVPAGKVYFSDRMGKKISRANIKMPAGETGANRTDIEELFVFSSGAAPIDLDIDHVNKKLYWTDRQLGTVQRAGIDVPSGQTAMNRSDAETLVMGLVEPIGISLDVPNNKMYFSELGGVISSAALDGKDLKKRILSSASATGVAMAYIPK
jgi:hypothetical protein